MLKESFRYILKNVLLLIKILKDLKYFSELSLPICPGMVITF